MCNAYTVGRSVQAIQVGGILRAAPLDEGETETRLIRRTDSAPVVTASLGVMTMRWGFERGRLGTITNSREDKLGGPMWSAAFRERRCLIPAASFYERVRKGKSAPTSSPGRTGRGSGSRGSGRPRASLAPATP